MSFPSAMGISNGSSLSNLHQYNQAIHGIHVPICCIQEYLVEYVQLHGEMFIIPIQSIHTFKMSLMRCYPI